jgi:hypothetical protein
MTFFKRLSGLCSLTAIMALAGGCSDYTYFNVGVYLRLSGDNAIDIQSQKKIGQCTISVFSGGHQIETSTTLKNGSIEICRPGVTGMDAPSKALEDQGVKVLDLGVLDYSSARDSGSIKFVVTAKDDNKEGDMAQGEAEASVKPGKVLEVPLVISLCSKDGCPVKDIK